MDDVAGMVRLTAGVELTLPGDIDPLRSELVFSVGTTPLAVIGGMYRWLSVYPFDCSEQLADQVLPLAALVRAGSAPDGRRYAPADAPQQLATAVSVLSRRQRADGGIGLWSGDDWTTPWLSAHAGEALLAARAAGAAVNDSVLARLADYLYRSVHERRPILGPLFSWFQLVKVRYGEDVAAVDFLSRFGRPDVAGENELLRVAPQLSWEDRVRLAGIIARRGMGDQAKRLLAPIWASVRVEGRRAVVTDTSGRGHYFWSWRRPLARLLSATLATDSASPLVGPLVESLVEQGRSVLAVGAALQTERRARSGRWFACQDCGHVTSSGGRWLAASGRLPITGH